MTSAKAATGPRPLPAWGRDPVLLEQLFDVAVAERDWKAVRAALLLLALCAPIRAGQLLAALQISAEVLLADTDCTEETR